MGQPCVSEGSADVLANVANGRMMIRFFYSGVKVVKMSIPRVSNVRPSGRNWPT